MTPVTFLLKVNPVKVLWKPSPVKTNFCQSSVKSQPCQSPVKTHFCQSPVKSQPCQSPVKTNLCQSPTSNVIYSCPVHHHKIGAYIVNQPANIAFYPMNTTRIHNVRITVTNQDDGIFDLQGERLLMSFICKPQSNL